MSTPMIHGQFWPSCMSLSQKTFMSTAGFSASTFMIVTHPPNGNLRFSRIILSSNGGSNGTGPCSSTWMSS